MISGKQSAPVRVLVVEDERAIADFVRMGLTFQGYTVRIAADGPEGLRQVRQFAPHLVILDSVLPGLGAAEVCRRLRLIARRRC